VTTDHGSKLFAYSGINASPRVDATSGIAIARLSTPCPGVISTPLCCRY
jgi:hypothetical protein